MHLFEAVSFATPQPPQFVSGNGGDLVDTCSRYRSRLSATPFPGAAVSSIVATNRFGFMTMERAGRGWTITARDHRRRSR